MGRGAGRKRSWDDAATCADQLRALRAVPGVPQTRCRELVAFLRGDSRGQSCGKNKGEIFRDIKHIFRTLKPFGDIPLEVPYNALPELINYKVSACPLFAAQMAAALDAANGSVTLVLFSDEATPGNVLAPVLERKCNLYYVAVLEWPCLHKEGLWLPFAVVRSAEKEATEHSYAEILRSCSAGYAPTSSTASVWRGQIARAWPLSRG